MFCIEYLWDGVVPLSRIGRLAGTSGLCSPPCRHTDAHTQARACTHTHTHTHTLRAVLSTLQTHRRTHTGTCALHPADTDTHTQARACTHTHTPVCSAGWKASSNTAGGGWQNGLQLQWIGSIPAVCIRNNPERREPFYFVFLRVSCFSFWADCQN